MDLSESPEIKKKYEKCKLTVKVWEHKFKKKYGRVPSKLDIKEADKEIRYAYKTYFDIKSAMLEQSFMDVDGFNSDEDKQETATTINNVLNDTSTLSENIDTNNIVDSNCSSKFGTCSSSNLPEGTDKVNDENSELKKMNTNKTWGEHLNNSYKKVENRKDDTKMTVNSSFSKKLFNGSKFSKRNPRKSLSFTSRKSESNLEAPKFLSQPEPNSCSSFMEQTPDVIEESASIDGTDLFKNKVKIVSAPQNAQIKSLNVIKSVLDNNYKSLRTLDTGWLHRTASSAGTELNDENILQSFGPQHQLQKETREISTFSCKQQNVSESCDKPANYVVSAKEDYESDDIIEESDEDENSRSICHIAKKRKIDQPISSQQIINTSSEIVSESKKLDFSNLFRKSGSQESLPSIPESRLLTKINNKSTVSMNTNMNLGDININENINSTYTGKNKASPKKIISKSSKKNSKTKDILEQHTEVVSVRKSGRSRKTLVTLENSSESENEDPFKSDNDSDDPEFNLTSKKDKGIPQYDSEDETILKNEKKIKIKAPKEKVPKSTLRSKKKQQTAESAEDTEENVYELEFSVAPRIKTVPRFNHLKKMLFDKTKQIDESEANIVEKEDEGNVNLNGVKDKRQQAKEKLEKKIASGGLNDNFVQINLKKKVYARGKKTMNFSKFKKQQWKNKKKALAGPNMDMGGCDGGNLTCFKCGKTGHFARQCKETIGDSLLPLEADEEVCPYPTLEEASNLAKDSRFIVRNPSIVNKKSSLAEDSDMLGNREIEEENEDDVDDDVNDDAKEENDFGFDELDEESILAETLRLEEYVQKLDVKQYLDTTTVVKPYYNLKENGDIIDTPKEVFNVLQMFGHASFRPGQEQAVMRILSGKSTLVTLSTGSGKSLCYQLPAYLYAKREPCISLIISPLVSLMEDQVTGIPHMLRAACLHTNQTKPQREKIMAALSAGELSILLISPEAIVAGEKSSGFSSLLRKLPPIAFACIDEAHCVSQWSHNFRPSYLMICRILREKLGVNTILGLTATATCATSDSIIEHLQIPDGRNGIIKDKPLPSNLRLTVSKDGNRDVALLSLLMSEQFSNFRSIIIYCIRREECERIASFLRTSLKFEKQIEPEAKSKKRKRLNVQAEPYHAGMAASRRRTIQKAFMSNELRIVVATVAFGMGINKSDLRAVIHYNMPKNFESYVQEVGRAGRDGLPAHCHLFLDSQGRDECELRRHIHSNSMDRHVIRKLLQRIFVPCSCKTICPRHEVAFSIQGTIQALDIPEENISTLLCYLELHDNRYIEVLSPAYITCKIISYGGPLQIRKAAKECPPLAMALALHKGADDNILEFPIIDVASAIGWDSGICKHKLKNLEWTSVNNQPKRSSLSVQFSNLGFRLLAPGNLTDSQLDEALDSLYERVVDQERTALLQLHALHSTLTPVTMPSYRACLSEDVSEKENILKEKIREYFESPKPLEILPPAKEKSVNEDQIVNDVKALVCMYRDNVFTGRAVARIFHGIQSPNYPAVIWGRCKFWRSHLSDDFNAICRIATREILKMR